MSQGMPLCPVTHPHFLGSTLCEVPILWKDFLLSSSGFWLLHKFTPPSEQLLQILPLNGSLSNLSQHFLLASPPALQPFPQSLFPLQIATSSNTRVHLHKLSISSILHISTLPLRHLQVFSLSVSYCQESFIVLLRAPLTFFVVFHVLAHSPLLDWEFGKYWDVAHSSLTRIRWDLSSVSYWESLKNGQLFLCLARDLISSSDLTLYSSLTHFPAPFSPPLYPAPFASPPRRGYLPQLLLSVGPFFVLSPDSELPKSCSCSGLWTFSKGFYFFLGSRRGNRSQGKHWGLPSGSSQYSRGVRQVHRAERDAQIICCGSSTVREGVLYLEILHRKGGIWAKWCSTGIETMMSSLPGRGNSLCSGSKTRKHLHISTMASLLFS